MIGCTFSEEMSGTMRRAGEDRDRPLRFSLDVAVPRALDLLAVATASACGRLHWSGVADDVATRGSIEIAAARERRLRYTLDFDAPDGTRYRLEGEKHIDLRHPFATWTTLPSVVRDLGTGEAVATGIVRFDLRRDLARLVGGTRLRRVPGHAPAPVARY